jgi:hypothetical protein
LGAGVELDAELDAEAEAAPVVAITAATRTPAPSMRQNDVDVFTEASSPDDPVAPGSENPTDGEKTPGDKK